jgi:hypothetical protein
MSLVEDFQMDTSAGLLHVALELAEFVRSNGGQPLDGAAAWLIVRRWSAG